MVPQFVANLASLFTQTRFQRLGGLFYRRHVGTLLRLDQPLVVLNREFRVNRKPNRRGFMTTGLATRKTDGKLDAFAVPGRVEIFFSNCSVVITCSSSASS